MNLTNKYLEALKSYGDWMLVSEWAARVGELHPDILEKAEKEAEAQVNDTTGLREIAARISSGIARGAYTDNLEIDSSERPRKVRYVSSEEHNKNVHNEIDEDTAPLKRSEIIKLAEQTLTSAERYRLEEFEAISKQLRRFFGLDFEVDHAKALLNPSDPGEHHPDNLNLLLKAHNARKNNDNWQRFTIEEQIIYIESVIKTQEVVASRVGVELEPDVLNSLIDRLKKVF